MSRPPMLILSAMALFVFTNGCAAPISQHTPPDRIIPLEPGEFVTAAQLAPLRIRHGEVHIERQGAGERTAGFRCEPAGDQWRCAIDGLRTMFVRLAEDGALVTTTVKELLDRVTVEYDPPMVTLPAKLVMGEPLQFECRMLVKSLRGGKVYDRGQCAYAVSLLGKRYLAETGGSASVYHVRTTLRIDLQLAGSHIVTDIAYLPGEGAVHQRIHQVTQVFGLFTATKIQDIRMLR